MVHSPIHNDRGSSPVRETAGRWPVDRRRGGAGEPATGGGAPLLDPGWLFLLSGCALLAATVLIPAREDVQEARWQRERAQAVEQHRIERTAAYRNYLEALDRAERPLIVSLAATQLNLAPKGMALLAPGAQTSQLNASVFAALEPPAPALPEWTRNTSVLKRWTTDDRSRLWLIAGGALCVLIGILPPARRG